MIQPIYLYGSDVLRRVAEPVDLSEKQQIQSLVDDLWDTLARSEGCGLAAPQIGVSKRVFVVDGDVMADVYPDLKGFKRTIINPVVVSQSRKQCEYNEGCLSVPGIYADVVRPESITLEYLNKDFEPCSETFGGFACRMIQHEFSHLEGVVFTDLVAPIRRKMIAKKLLNISRGKVATAYNSKIK